MEAAGLQWINLMKSCPSYSETRVPPILINSVRKHFNLIENLI